jgi:hypothetical protein
VVPKISNNQQLDLMPIDLSRLNLIDQLLNPIQKLIRAILPDFIQKNLKDPEVRDAIVLAVDMALVAQFPVAAAIPAALRQSIIRKQLDIVIDDIVLVPEDAFKDFRSSIAARHT